MTHSRRKVLGMLEQIQMRPSRALGQNFVVDANTVRRIARLAGIGVSSKVVEIGAGLGSLTLALAETGAFVTAIEVDRKLVYALREVVAHLDNVDVLEANALSVDWDSVVARDTRAVLVANLPYNVGTTILLRVLDEAPQIDRALVMVQREVAERIAAGPGNRAYGAVSVKVRYHGVAKVLGTVPANVFVPKPEVESALVELRRFDSPAVDIDPQRLFMVVQAGFAQRRKMLRRALGGVVDPEAFERAGIEPTRRAEELDVAEWAKLAAR